MTITCRTRIAQTKRERRTQGRSQSPREEAHQNSTWPTLPCSGSAVQALLLMFKSPEAQVRGFLGSRNLTLARHQIVRHGHHVAAIIIGVFLLSFGRRRIRGPFVGRGPSVSLDWDAAGGNQLPEKSNGAPMHQITHCRTRRWPAVRAACRTQTRPALAEMPNRTDASQRSANDFAYTDASLATARAKLQAAEAMVPSQWASDRRMSLVRSFPPAIGRHIVGRRIRTIPRA